MSEQELQRLGGKARLWNILHPETNGRCLLCPHLHDLEWCRTHPRYVYDKTTDTTVIMTGRLSNTKGTYRCIEWARYV